MAGSAVALTLAGCQWSSPITTEKSYDPSDGVAAQVGALHMNNLIIIADRQGGPGNLVGLAINGSGQPAQITAAAVSEQAAAPSAALTVPANGSQQFSEKGGRATSIPAVQVAPGAMMQVLLQTNLGQTVVEVPVLPAEGYYEGYGPTAAATPAPTSAPTQSGPAPTQTDAPTATPSVAPTETATATPSAAPTS